MDFRVIEDCPNCGEPLNEDALVQAILDEGILKRPNMLFSGGGDDLYFNFPCEDCGTSIGIYPQAKLIAMEVC